MGNKAEPGGKKAGMAPWQEINPRTRRPETNKGPEAMKGEPI